MLDTSDKEALASSPAMGAVGSVISVSTDSVLLLAFNPARKGLVVRNTALGGLWVHLGAIAAPFVSTFRLGTNRFLSMGEYGGVVSAVYENGSGNVYVTEIL